MINRQIRGDTMNVISQDVLLIKRYKNTMYPRKTTRYRLMCDIATHYIVKTRAEEEKCSITSMLAILVHLGEERFGDIRRIAEALQKKDRQHKQETQS